MGFIHISFQNLLKKMCSVINLPLPQSIPPPLQVFQVILRTFDLEIYSQTSLKVAFVMSSLIFKAQKLDLHKS